VAHEIYDYTGHNCSQRNGKKSSVEMFLSRSRNTFNRFTTKDSYSLNIIHNKESTAV
jgi:hypothetical protein